jgi:hypothetical protein
VCAVLGVVECAVCRRHLPHRCDGGSRTVSVPWFLFLVADCPLVSESPARTSSPSFGIIVRALVTLIQLSYPSRWRGVEAA